jgi:glycosyltransferase involved in cell wall biosynthesis
MSEISVVILCYGAGDRIYSFVNKTVGLLNRFIEDWEIVLVGNYYEGTGDKTPDIVKEISQNNPRIKSVVMPKQGRMGWDARSGLKAANGRYICLIDGDEQMSYRDIVRVYRVIKREDVDIVTTYRAVRYDGFMRRLTSFVYNLLFRLLFQGTKSRDINSKPKIFKREAYEKIILKSNDWFLDAEIMIQIRRKGLKLVEIPAKFYKCRYRESFVDINAVFEFLKNLFFARMKEFSKDEK